MGLIGISGAIIWQSQDKWQHFQVWPRTEAFYLTGANSGDAFGEYASKSRATWGSFPVTSAVTVLSGDAQVTELRRRPTEIAVEIKAQTEAVIRFNVMQFPGWSYWMDKQELDILAEEPKIGQIGCYITPKSSSPDDDSGMVACQIPPGERWLAAVNLPTLAGLLGNWLTLSGSIIWLWLLRRSFCPRIMKWGTLSR